MPAKTEDRNFVVFDDTILNVLNKYGVDGKAIKLERKDKGGYAIPETVVPPPEKKAEGGVAGLSDQARDMFKGPKGIGAYQPFMVG